MDLNPTPATSAVRFGIFYLNVLLKIGPTD